MPRWFPKDTTDLPEILRVLGEASVPAEIASLHENELSLAMTASEVSVIARRSTNAARGSDLVPAEIASLHENDLSFAMTEGSFVRRPRLRSPGVVWLALFLALAAVEKAQAHTFERTTAVLRVDRDRTFEARLKLDLDTLALGADPATDLFVARAALTEMSEADFKKTEEGLRDLLRRRLRVRVDGKPVEFVLSLPQARAQNTQGLEVFGLEALLAGRVPEGGRTITVFASRSFPALELSFADEGTGRSEFHICRQGEECPEIKLTAGPGESSLAEFVWIGFQHIVPLGLDHILFVLALFLGGRDLKALLIQTGVFTLAHSATLALSTFGVLSLSPRIVEPLIALSIGVVGLQNFHRPSGVSRGRMAVVFFFGLLHGLGFAGILAGTPLAEGQKFAALLLFNVGVELGQVSVLGAAFVASLLFKDPERYRRYVQVPLSLVLSVVGLVWAVARLAS